MKTLLKTCYFQKVVRENKFVKVGSCLYLIQILTNMFKRTVTPLAKDKPLSRNMSNNNQKVLKDIKNIIPAKPILSRNPSNSKITFTTQSSSIPVMGVNPESPDPFRRRESLKSSGIN
jgi:hypothetical protein